MILNDKTEWEPEPEDILMWQKLYPNVDVYQELNAMTGWCEASPNRRKTRRGIKRFCNSWLSRAQDKGGSPLAKKDGVITKTREMSALDDLTHDFCDNQGYRDSMLKKYGQYFKDGIRFLEVKGGE